MPNKAPQSPNSFALPKALRCSMCGTTLTRVGRPWLMRTLLPGSSYFQCGHCGRGSILRFLGINIPL